MLKSPAFLAFLRAEAKVSNFSYSCHCLELSRTRTLWKRMCWKSVLERFPNWWHSLEPFPWGQKARLLTMVHGERRQPPIFGRRIAIIILSDKICPKSTASMLWKLTTLAFHPSKEFTGLSLVWPFCATFHSRTPAKMFSRADRRFLLLSPSWYNLTVSWHQGQLETGNSYVTAL